MSDNQRDLIAGCIRGDDGAWRSLVDRYASLVYAIGRRGGLRPDACDDLAQVVFAILARHIAAIREERALAGWLSTTAVREMVRMQRRLRRDAAREQPLMHDVATTDMELERIQRQFRLRLALQGLDERCRTLLSELYLSDPPPSYETLALGLGLSTGSIGPMRGRCLARLARLLRDDPAWSEPPSKFPPG